MYFWKLNSNNFPESLYHPHLPLRVKGLETSAPEHCGVFYRGRREEFEDFFSLEDSVVFAMTFVPLRNILAKNITQICGAFSLIRQK